MRLAILLMVHKNLEQVQMHRVSIFTLAQHGGA